MNDQSNKPANNTPAVQRQPHPIEQFKTQLERAAPEFSAALPAHIPVERFVRVVLTAATQNPDLLNPQKADRRSLLASATKAAQDGLLPDGREGALVIFGGKVQWMPMIGGIRKKARNSGELSTWDAHVVFENDHFEYELGDEPYIRHRPLLDGDRGAPVAAYSIAKLKDGSLSREVMSKGEIEKVRAVSRAKNGDAWTKWWEEMARKTVARRHSKVLPMSSDLDDLIRRDDDLYSFGKRGEHDAVESSRSSMGDRLAALASGGGLDASTGGADDGIDDGPVIDNDTGEVIDDRGRQDDGPADRHDGEQTTADRREPASGGGKRDGGPRDASPEQNRDQRPSGRDTDPGDRTPPRQSSGSKNDGEGAGMEPRADDTPAMAKAHGQRAKEQGLSRRARPAAYNDSEDLMDAWDRGYSIGKAPTK